MKAFTNGGQDPTTNKIKNEEFKVWKKTIPSLYQYINSLKPNFSSSADSKEGEASCSVVFTHDIFANREKGILRASVLVSRGSNIYEVEFPSPLGLHVEEQENGGAKELVDPVFEGSMLTEDIIQPTWTFDGENIENMFYIGKQDMTVIAISSIGSLAWFKNGTLTPVRVLTEEVAESFRDNKALSHKDMISVDFAMSTDQKVIVKSQSVMVDNKKQSLLKIIDNADKLGNVTHTIPIPGTSVTPVVKFQSAHLFSTCSDDNVLRFWDVRKPAKPIWELRDTANEDGNLVCLDTSPVVDLLFATGSDNGVIKLWDLRSVIAASPDEQPTEIARLYHPGNDPVAGISFSFSSPTMFLTVGKSGNIYHWDIEYMLQDSHSDDSDEAMADPEELQQQCLKFLHTGGGRRSLRTAPKRSTVAWHEKIADIVTCVDSDTLITIYKPYFGRTDDSGDEDPEYT
ncbi:uncharacterized protein Ecym_8336 [Eremothecium cymbalariae DBVPG|uniref:Uncharacterized protein n=1 Tax=Eremothecium cymbalariae (strain CBS 270.75 / DBVPG 7215 / KCTC 17166 / NRRL Y-17582) TaxID=931890 RepID=G8JXP0_ERECY|nr:Hypothetical protein Ecym_8336 [Eremothecium cymbalariae DBVPG\